MKKGFTLIELMIVIGVISIITAIVIPRYSDTTSEAKVANVRSNLANLRTAIQMYQIKNEGYPDFEDNHDDLGDFSGFYSKSKLPETPSYSGMGETNSVSSKRTDEGGWLYSKETGDLYANLSNGTYTGDTDNEIWDGEDIEVEESSTPLESLKNGSYESLKIGLGTYNIVDASRIEGWETTASDNKIEVWGSGFQGLDAVDGDYFIELNATQEASLYQEVETTPGTTLTWSISHRGRAGEDTATISVNSGDEVTVLETMADGNSEWGYYTGTYEVPEGQTSTTFSLDAVDTAGSISVGNFVDNFLIEVE